jgi:hypothetical protein
LGSLREWHRVVEVGEEVGEVRRREGEEEGVAVGVVEEVQVIGSLVGEGEEVAGEVKLKGEAVEEAGIKGDGS